MDKFIKKINKISKITENALVIGDGFGNLPNILLAHNSVFIVDSNDISMRSKKLIYRENLNNLTSLTHVRVIYIDLNKLNRLEELKMFWSNNKACVIIEGGEPISREFSKPLYDTGWNCTRVEKHFHVWEQKK
jgi:hypothetical protein